MAARRARLYNTNKLQNHPQPFSSVPHELSGVNAHTLVLSQ